MACENCKRWEFDDTIAGDVIPHQRWGVCKGQGFAAGFEALNDETGPSGQGVFVTRDDHHCAKYTSSTEGKP